MTRSELIQQLARRFPQLEARDADFAVREIFEAISETLARNRRVEIRGFGSFALNYRPPRNGRNPKTGVPVQVPEKWVPHFKAGKEMRERINASLQAKQPTLKKAA